MPTVTKCMHAWQIFHLTIVMFLHSWKYTSRHCIHVLRTYTQISIATTSLFTSCFSQSSLKVHQQFSVSESRICLYDTKCSISLLSDINKSTYRLTLTARDSYRDLFVTGSFITIHSVISPYLLKCSCSPSAQQNTNVNIWCKWQFLSGACINLQLSLYY